MPIIVNNSNNKLRISEPRFCGSGCRWGYVFSSWAVLEIMGLLVLGYITAPNISGYQNGTLIVGTTLIMEVRTQILLPFEA